MFFQFIYLTSICLVLVYECNSCPATLNFAQTYAISDLIGGSIEGGQGWGYVTLKSFDEKFTVVYNKNQNDRYRTFYPEKKGTQKRITRKQAPLLLLGEEIYLFGRPKFEGSRFLASSNHLRPLFHVKETVDA